MNWKEKAAGVCLVNLSLILTVVCLCGMAGFFLDKAFPENQNLGILPGFWVGAAILCVGYALALMHQVYGATMNLLHMD